MYVSTIAAYEQYSYYATTVVYENLIKNERYDIKSSPPCDTKCGILGANYYLQYVFLLILHYIIK